MFPDSDQAQPPKASGASAPAAGSSAPALGLAEDDEELPLTATTPAQRKRAFIILFLSLICVGMGQTTMFAVLPQVSRDYLGFSEFETGLLFVVSGIAWVVAAPFWGRKSDSWGRRPVILIGLVAYGLASFLFAFAMQLGIWGVTGKLTTFALMAFARAVFGLLGPGTMVAAQAYVVDRTRRSQRTGAIAGLTASFGVGNVLGPGIGAMLVVFGLLAPFYLLSVLGFLSAAAIWFLLPERTPPKEHKSPPPMSPFDPRISTLIGFSIVMGMVQAIPTQTIGFYMADVLHLTDTEAVQLVGVALMASAMAGLVSQLVLVQRFGLSAGTLIRWGLVIGLGSMVVLLFARDYGPLVTALVLNGLGFGMARPGIAAASSLSVGRDEQGAVSGVMNGTGVIGFMLCPLIALPIYALSPQAPYVLSAALMALLVLMNWVLPAFRRPLDRAPVNEETDVGLGGG